MFDELKAVKYLKEIKGLKRLQAQPPPIMPVFWISLLLFVCLFSREVKVQYYNNYSSAFSSRFFFSKIQETSDVNEALKIP